MVMVRALDWNIKKKIETPEEDFLNLLKNSTAVFISNYDPETMIKLNDLCHSIEGVNINFFAACDWGYYGFSFTDLGRKYKYISEEVTQKEIYAEGPSENKLKNEQPEKTYVEKYLDFVPLRQALAVKSGKAGIGITKRTSPVLILVHILFKFHQLKDRYPDSQYGDEDIELLNRLKEEVADDLAYSKSSLKILEDDKFHHHVYGELSPVSAIIGGALGQDMIRSITHQDAPIRNFFLFNGLRLSGTVESIGK
uniref:THIF-type NAD/FAD binding fold domain-containing protein n=2 Tax=Tetranychus urticae TaxID=32264 RepID=T1KQ29_TETUR